MERDQSEWKGTSTDFGHRYKPCPDDVQSCTSLERAANIGLQNGDGPFAMRWRITPRIGRLDKAAAKAVSQKLRGFLGERRRAAMPVLRTEAELTIKFRR
jgi:hypothetical protein